MVRFAHVPKAEARDLHCYSHVSDNLGERRTNALLWGLGTRWKMLRPMLLRVH